MKKTFLFVPYKQIGDFVFGMSREQIKEMCGEPRKSRMYGFPVEDSYLDDYGYMYTLCSKKQLLEALQFLVIISEDDIYLEYNDQLIHLSKDIPTLVEQLHRITDDLVLEMDGEYRLGYSSQKLGLKVYCPEDVVEQVLVHDPHYYDEEEEYLSSLGS